MSPVARAYHSSERVITGSERSAVATSVMDITSRSLVPDQRGADPSRELLRRKPLTLQNVGEERRSEPPASQGDRVKPHGDVVCRRHFSHDRGEPADREMVFDRYDQRRL